MQLLYMLPGDGGGKGYAVRYVVDLGHVREVVEADGHTIVGRFIMFVRGRRPIALFNKDLVVGFWEETATKSEAESL